MRIATILVIAMAVAAAGCSTLSVKHDYDQYADFSSYRSFAWIQQPTTTTGTGDAQTAREVNTLLDQRIKRAVNVVLMEKGMQLKTDSPDMLLAYHTGVQNKVDVTDWGYSYPGYGAGWYGGRDVSVYNYEEGTLIIDMIDAKTKQLVFRASGTDVLDENPTPEQIEKKINDVVKQMLAAYPPGKR